MALSTISRVVTSPEASAERAAIVNFNGLLAAMRAWAVVMDADAGITYANFTTDLEAAAGCKTILTVNGSTVTEP